MMKKSDLVYIGSLFLLFLINFELGFSQSMDSSIGLSSNSVDGNSIGGMENDIPKFSRKISHSDFSVNDKRELLKALTESKAGDVIYIDDKASIDLSGESKIKIPAGVILASGRGINGSKGALLYTNKNGTFPLFTVEESGTEIFGIRLKGPDTGIYSGGVDAFANKSEAYKKVNRNKLYHKNMYGVPVSYGIGVSGPNFSISNCEVFGWTYAGICLEGNATNAKIHHNYIHHNQRFGLGYGVVLKKGASALITANLFNFNRHSVAGTGEEDITVEVSYNRFLEDNNTTWAIDMHGGQDRNDGTNIAGRRIEIHHNEIRLKGKALGIVIRGVPTKEAIIYNNLLTYVDRLQKSETSTNSSKNQARDGIIKGIEQRYAKGRMNVYNNVVN